MHTIYSTWLYNVRKRFPKQWFPFIGFHRSLEMPSFKVYVGDLIILQSHPKLGASQAQHLEETKCSVGALTFSEIGQGGGSWRGPPVLSAQPCRWLPNYITDVVLPPRPSAGGDHDLMRVAATARRCQKPAKGIPSWSLLGEPRLRRGEGGEHADGNSSCFSSSGSLGPALPTPDLLKTVCCAWGSLSVHLGKDSNPNRGLGRSWLGKSVVLITGLPAAGGRWGDTEL